MCRGYSTLNFTAKGGRATDEEKDYAIPENLLQVLRDSNWYKTVIEVMADGIIATDMNRRIAYINRNIAKLLRYEPEELIGKDSLTIIIQEDRQKVIRETESRYKEKRTSQYEVTLKTKFGTSIPVLITATPILGKEGETIGTYALITDIRDRKLVERELRKKNDELQTLYNNLLELYEQLGSIIAETTKIHAEIFLFTSKDCVYCAPAEEVLQEVLSAYGGKITYRKIDIEEEPEYAEKYEILSLPTIVIGDEKITSVPDVYKLHSALFSALVPEEKFRRTRQELDNIINYSPIAIFTINDEGILTSMNPLVEMLIDKKRSEVLGVKVLQQEEEKKALVFPKSLLQHFRKGLQGESISLNRLSIKRINAKNPKPFSIISLKVVPMATKEGKINEILVLAEDVTTIALQEEELQQSYRKLEKLNKKLMQLNKERAHFVEITTSNLLEPLKNSKELIDQILSGELGDFNEELFGTIEYLRNNLENVSKSIIDILDYTTLETQGFTLTFKKEKVKAIAMAAMEAVGSIVIDKGFLVNFNIPDKLNVWCDKEQIVRVFKNLILNAIKFTDIDCRIEISARSVEDNFVEIAVKDNGIGIAKKDLERIFNQYVKVNPKSPGSGLGLSVVKSIVEVHGGSVWAESKGNNKGSTFYFTLPKDKKTYQKFAPQGES